jgi:hypothetical protein
MLRLNLKKRKKLRRFRSGFFQRTLPGCQMVCFLAQNPNLDIFWSALERKMLVYFMAIWNILRPLGIIYGRLV